MLLFINILVRYKPNLDITLSIFPTKKRPVETGRLRMEMKKFTNFLPWLFCWWHPLWH